MSKVIGILGGGKWGTALGKKLTDSCRIKLYSRDLNSGNCKKVGELEYFGDISRLKDSDLLILAVPSFAIREVVNNFTPFYAGQPVVGVAKGIEKGTSLLPSQVVKEIWPEAKYAHLSGPTFAEEVIQGLPAFVSLAVDNLNQKEIFQELLNLKGFRVELTEDLIGVQLGGALKNVIAIATGLSDGLGLGENFRAALIVAGFKDMISLGRALGVREETFYGPAGLGDLILTAVSLQSRNYSLGIELAKSLDFKNKLNSKTTFEGLITVGEAYILSRKFNLKVPVIEGVYKTICLNQEPQRVFEEIQNEIRL